jgi:signal transduction histidine kinase/CheY-like chemotaxis protein
MKNNAEKNEGKSPFKISELIAIIVLLICLLAGLTVRYYSELNKQLFEERQLHLTEFTDKVTEVIDAIVEYSWRELRACEHIVINESEGIESGAELLSVLGSTDDFINADSTRVLAFDEKGSYYSSDGFSGYWRESSLIETSAADTQQAIVEIPHISNEVYFLFLERLDTPIELGENGRKITHIALAVSTSSMSEELSVSGFGENCYSYIINQAGRRLYKYTYENNFINGYNVLKSISGYRFINGGSYEDLATAIESGKSVAQEFIYLDEETQAERNWFVAMASVKSADWYVMLFVPTDVLGANTGELLNQTSRFFIILTLIVVIILTIFVYVLVTSQADKKLLRERELSNELLSQAAQKAEDASKAKGEFLSRMSHDIRTPINAVMGMTGIAVKHIDDKERVLDCLFKIEGSSQHLLSLLNDVLDMSRIESGKTGIVNERFDLSLCLESCAAIIEGQLSTRDLELVKEFENFEYPIVTGDELHLRQIFINILGNAVKFTLDGGKIYFRASHYERDGESIFRFEVEDTGIGMSEEFLPHIFEAFTQEDEGSRTNYKGTGLGMAITKQFTELMNGEIWVESELNKGTKFTLEIPLEINRDVKPDTKADEESFDLSGMRIMLVEDNELNMEIAEELLKEQGAEVTSVENGKLALELFEKSDAGTFDAILMDVMMPVMDGLTATQKIRATQKADAKTIPILAMTANAYDEDVRKTKEAGMNAHLSKPIDVVVLYKTLAKFYEKNKGNGGEGV